MVRDTARAHAGRLGPHHQGPDSFLRTETGVEDDGEGLNGSVMGVPGGGRLPRGPCQSSQLCGLSALAESGKPNAENESSEASRLAAKPRAESREPKAESRERQVRLRSRRIYLRAL